jgi:hypothetical protein
MKPQDEAPDSRTHARVWKFPIALNFFGRDSAEHFELHQKLQRALVARQ